MNSNNSLERSGQISSKNYAKSFSPWLMFFEAIKHEYCTIISPWKENHLKKNVPDLYDQ